MGRRNYVQELEHEIFRGVDNTTPSTILAPGYVRDARNANIGPSSGFEKRDGTLKQLGTGWTGMAIRSGVEYRTLSGTTQRLFFGTDDTTTAALGRHDGLAITTVVPSLTPSARLAFAQIEERLYGFNGDSTNAPFVYEGAGPRELGLDRPIGFSDASITAGSGGNLEVGSYIFAYTYAIRNSSTFQVIAESSPSDFGKKTLTSGQDRAILNVVASSQTVSGSLEIVIRIWRTVVGGSVMFLDSIVPNVSNPALNIDTSDSDLETQQLELDNSRLNEFDGYDKAKFPVIARNRLFVAHTKRNEVRFSKIGQDGPLIESFPAVNYASVEGIHGAADKIVGLGQVLGVPIALKQRSIGRLEEVGLPDITQAEDLVTYLYREISQTVGAVDHFAQCQVFDELIFLGRDNIYATNGQSVRPVADTIQETIRGLDLSDLKKSKISMINDTKFKRIYIQVFENTTSAQPTFTIVGDYQKYPDFRWTFYTAGSDIVTHPGLRAGSFFQFTNTLNGALEVYFGNSNKDGQYYKMNTGTSDDDNGTERGIYFKVVSRPYAMGQPLVTKLYKNVRIFAEAADDTYVLEFCSIFDLGVDEEFCQDFEIKGTGTEWDIDNWADDDDDEEVDELIWSGPALAELTYDPHRKAKFMQLVFKQTDQDAPVTLLGWGVSGSIFSGL